MAKKPVITAKEAAAMIPEGATIMCGGFLACGQARAVVKELVASGKGGAPPNASIFLPRLRL